MAKVPKSVQHPPDAYKGTGFDRGHLAPSETIDFTVSSNRETFTMINIVPQHPGLNRQAWRSLERYTFSLSKMLLSLWCSAMMEFTSLTSVHELAKSEIEVNLNGSVEMREFYHYCTKIGFANAAAVFQNIAGGKTAFGYADLFKFVEGREQQRGVAF